MIKNKSLRYLMVLGIFRIFLILIIISVVGKKLNSVIACNYLSVATTDYYFVQFSTAELMTENSNNIILTFHSRVKRNARILRLFVAKLCSDGSYMHADSITYLDIYFYSCPRLRPAVCEKSPSVP